MNPLKTIEGEWNVPVAVTPNNFIYKSLSNWACNIAVGCNHACRFCYVPDASTIKLGKNLEKLGVTDPDAQWGEYVFLRPWHPKSFASSVRRAMETPVSELKKDGNRAIMFCSTTDAYQLLRDRALHLKRQNIVRDALKIIRDESDLNVRILTRSPLARKDFDLFKTFGNRLLLGSSIPTLNNKLARIYEPHAPAPQARLSMLFDANLEGIKTFAAVAPTYPECDEADIRETLFQIRSCDPVTIFHEPINIRAENVKRISEHAKELEITLKTEVFETTDTQRVYAIAQLRLVEKIAGELGLKQLHLWPDKDLRRGASGELLAWLEKWHNRISEWPK